MSALWAAATVLLLALAALLASVMPGGVALATVGLPYAAFTILLVGVCHRVLGWASSPVPFRIPTTCGQQKSLPWIRTAPIDDPSTTTGAIARVMLEAVVFRSLLRNTRPHFQDGRLRFSETRVLWLAALAFHVSLLVIVLRHLRFALEPAPGILVAINAADGMLQIGAPPLLITDVMLALALGYLLLRRLLDPVMRYISMFSDYFALLLILAIAVSGALMRYVDRVDVVSVKQFVLGLATFDPIVPAAPSPVFLVHLVLVSALAVYIPFSKLMHFGGVFLSPTRNLANDSRRKRHVNPWNPPLATGGYAKWEAEFADKLELAGFGKVDDVRSTDQD